ncbi:MAG: DUF3817 domain-containing protein [Actinomycetota bacterium]
MTTPDTDSARTGTRWVRLAGAVEATTYLVLLTTLVWRVAADGPDLSATIGPIHGLAFGAYFVAVAQAAADRSWRARRVVRLLLAAVIPAAGYFVDRHLHDRP